MSTDPVGDAYESAVRQATGDWLAVLTDPAGPFCRAYQRRVEDGWLLAGCPTGFHSSAPVPVPAPEPEQNPGVLPLPQYRAVCAHLSAGREVHGIAAGWWVLWAGVIDGGYHASLRYFGLVQPRGIPVEALSTRAEDEDAWKRVEARVRFTPSAR